MKNIKMIVLKILIFVIIVQMLYMPRVYAQDHVDDIITGADSFIQLGKQESDGLTDVEGTDRMVGEISSILIAIGIAVAVIVGLILGIQYMITSVEEKAKIKETIIIYIVGCIATFGAFGIWRVVVSVLKSM